jgi:hypothetical protein
MSARRPTPSRTPRPAEAAGAGGGLVAVVAAALGAGPTLVAVLAGVAGVLPGAVTFVVSHGGLKGTLALLWHGRSAR